MLFRCILVVVIHVVSLLLLSLLLLVLFVGSSRSAATRDPFPFSPEVPRLETGTTPSKRDFDRLCMRVRIIRYEINL